MTKVSETANSKASSHILYHSNMKRWLTTVPLKPSIFALYRSLRRQTRLLPHEYLRYFLAIFPPLCCFVTFGRQFFRLKLSADIKSALDDTRKYRPRRATFKRLRKVTNLIIGFSAASNFSIGTFQANPR